MALKPLVIAGTHHRENEFSHAVVSRLRDEIGDGSYSLIEGADGCRRGHLFDYASHALLKIDELGDWSRAYKADIPADQLAHIERIVSRSPNLHCAEFYRRSQWTSVHDEAIARSGASFFIDLHSCHEFTRGANGTAAWITPHVRDEYVPLMAAAVASARMSAPAVYGGNGGYHDILRRIDQMSLEHLAKKGVLDQTVSEIRAMRDLADGEFRRRVLQIHKYGHWEEAQIAVQRALPDGWSLRSNRGYIGDSGTPQEIAQGGYIAKEDNFLFEAVHWGERQVAAFTSFYLKHLLPVLRTERAS